MIPLVVIRPQPGAERTAQAARALGLAVEVHPLFVVSTCPWDPVQPAQIDALLIGSANAVRHAGPALDAVRDKPAYAVGEETAAACRSAGIAVAAVGAGGLQALLDTVPPGARLLRLAGAERTCLAIPPGVIVVERIVYESRPQPIGDGLAALFRRPCVIALHSAAAAQWLGSESARLDIHRSVLGLATIGPRVTAAAGPGWARVATAGRPTDAALLACAVHLCQNRGGEA